MDMLLIGYLLCLLVPLAQGQCSGIKTIKTNSDAESINSCTTFNGNIVISSEASGDIYLNGVVNVTGSFIAKNALSLTTLNADSLVYIWGDVQLSNLPQLNNFNFTLLEHVQSLTWTALPALQGLSFYTGLSEVNDISITNTGLINLSGLTPTYVNSIDVHNNTGLQTVGLDDLLTTTSSLSFVSNAPNIVLQFESLQLVGGNLTFYGISGLSLPDLQNVTGSFVCDTCSITTFEAASVQIVEGDFKFTNSDFQTLQFPDLTTVGGNFEVSENGRLNDISGFPLLQYVRQSLTLEGDFESVDLPTLEVVGSGADVTTTGSNATICDFVNKLYTNGVIKGTINCQTSADDGSDSGLSKGAIAGIVIGAVVVLAAIACAIFFLIRRRRQKRRQQNQTKPLALSEPEINILPGYEEPSEKQQRGEKAEMYVDPRSVAEIGSGGSDRAELSGGGTAGMAELGTGMERNAREIPGVHEAEGDPGPGATGTMSMSAARSSERGSSAPFSPVSPIDSGLGSMSGVGSASDIKDTTSERELIPK